MAESKPLRWGDVFLAAFAACCAVGPKAEVDAKRLPKDLRAIIDISGDMDFRHPYSRKVSRRG